ncbi:hypothetical protein [Subtercola endophyticus]|uniref:hypothetical protein n=1 Tax=Subtercola endophyticus TaxID=2895559 RepID=UPI001E45011B|nr:hypothetical protein [Subtercola endophyticus]UFS58006.1 hypothetical protein LQ955_13375 [Subtercola endophyticus]
MSDLPPNLDEIDDLPRGHHEQVYFTYGKYQYLLENEHADRWGVRSYRLVDWHELGRIHRLAAGSFAAAEFPEGAYTVHLTGHAHKHDAEGAPLTWRDAVISLTNEV